jgi:hypothetical protein
LATVLIDQDGKAAKRAGKSEDLPLSSLLGRWKILKRLALGDFFVNVEIFIVIIKNMFRWITSGSGAVKEYFFVKQDPAYRPLASKRHLDGTTAELPGTTCPLAGWGDVVCCAKTLVAVCQ